MIYTITFNPALDYIVSVKDFQMGLTNRTDEETLLPGGKGINVSIVLKFIEIPEGFSRINVKLKNAEGTEINGKGPDIDKESLAKLLDRLACLQEGDVLVLAGSIPASLPDSIYQEICEMLAGKGITIVVDATKELLVKVLPFAPFLIKPNHHELGEIFGVSLKTADEVIPYAQKLRGMGAANVLVSSAFSELFATKQEGEELLMQMA